MTGRFMISSHRNLVVTPKEVWDLTTDTSRYAEWVASVLEVKTHHGSACVGSTYTERVASVGPMSSNPLWTVRQLEPLTLRVDSGVGLAPLRDVVNIFRFAPISGGSATSMTYEFHFDITPRFVGPFVERLLGRSMRSDFDESMRNLEMLILSERSDETK